MPSSGCDLAPSLGHGVGMPMGYLPFAALAAIQLGGPQGDTARLTVEDSRVDGTESGVPQPDRSSGLAEHFGRPVHVLGHSTMIKGENGFDVRNGLSGIQTETLVIYGAKDGFWPLEMVAETAYRMPHGRLIMYPELGHSLVTSPRLVADVVAFLHNQEGSTRAG